METFRQELVQATCKWLESVVHWDGIAETERSDYRILRNEVEGQQKFQAQEEDFPENLRAELQACPSVKAYSQMSRPNKAFRHESLPSAMCIHSRFQECYIHTYIMSLQDHSRTRTVHT